MSRLPCFRRLARRSLPFALGMVAACAGAGRDDDIEPDTAVETIATDTIRGAARLDSTLSPDAPKQALSPLADTIAQRLVFAPVMQRWFAAAARGKRLVVDLGRVDIDLKKDSARIAALEEAATALSPFPVGTRLRLRGRWGEDDATIARVTSTGGRIVAEVASAPRVDSLAQELETLVATAERVEATAPPATASCDRSEDEALRERLTGVAASNEAALRAGDQPVYPRLQKAVRARRSIVTGCFGDARAIVIVTLYAGDYEWVRERVLLVGDSVRKLTVRDLRFRAHEGIQALDGDGDGVDDLAARAWAPRSTGTVILGLRDGARLERIAAGFATER